jgi:hypothetical protein
MALQPHNRQFFKVAFAAEGSGSVASGIFAQKVTGQGWSRETTTYADPDKNIKGTLVGLTEIQDITLSSIFDAAQRGLIDWLKAQKANPTRFTVTLQPVDQTADAKPIGAAFTHRGCQLKSANYPEMDRESAGVAMIEITYVPEDIE